MKPNESFQVIASPGILKSIETVSILDVTGSVIAGHVFNGGRGHIDVSDLTSGIYFSRIVMSDDRVVIKKIIVTRQLIKLVKSVDVYESTESTS